MKKRFTIFDLDFSSRLRFLWNRLRERLWVKPLALCLVSVLAAFLVGLADRLTIAGEAPEVSLDSLETLLKILSSSMLVIATFAVGAMVQAYASATQTATPRAFAVVLADDVSQNALSTFLGAFIYSIVTLTALLNGYYESVASRFALFLLTVVVFAIVVLSFVRWIDRIAKLGRLETIIERVEAAAQRAFERRARRPTLGATPAGDAPRDGRAVTGTKTGHVQRIEIMELQEFAEREDCRIVVAALPGAFVSPGQPLAWVVDPPADREAGDVDDSTIGDAFWIGKDRTFDDDPRFGLVALSEVASRALSPAVNDPGTALSILGSFSRLLSFWAESRARRRDADGGREEEAEADRVAVPELSPDDLFFDAFGAVSRDGAGILEVALRIQSTLHALAEVADGEVSEAAKKLARRALLHAEASLKLDEERREVEEATAWAS